MEGLLEGCISFVVICVEWEKEFGIDLVKFLIEKNYFKLVDLGLKKDSLEERYCIYDDFFKGLKELESINVLMKLDIENVR